VTIFKLFYFFGFWCLEFGASNFWYLVFGAWNLVLVIYWYLVLLILHIEIKAVPLSNIYFLFSQVDIDILHKKPDI